MSPLVTPNELVDAACPKIGALGSAFYFIPETIGPGKERGVDCSVADLAA